LTAHFDRITNRLMRSLTLISTLLCAITLTGCGGEGRTRGPATGVTAVHAAPSYPQIGFLREERVAAALDYRSASTSFFEVGQYDFNLEILPPGQGGSQRLLSFSETLQPETDYLFIIAEEGGLLVPLIITKARFDLAATNSEVALVHAAPATPPVDVYFTAPGANLSAANPLGSAAFKQNVAPQVFAAGDYQLSLTELGNPLNVLFASPTMTLLAGQWNFFVVTDGAGEGTAPIGVVRVTENGSAVLIDVNVLSALRVINAATDAQARDVFLDGDFSTPFAAAAAYGAPTDFASLARGNHTLAATPAGNPGVVEGQETPAIFPGRMYSTLITGTAGALKLSSSIEDRRRITGEAHLRIVNGATQFTSLDFLVLPVGTPVTGFSPFARVDAGIAIATTPLAPGDYELTLRVTGSNTIAIGPLPITLAGAGIYSVLALNGATSTTADVVLFDDF
jgi:hypothetical protein